MRATIITVLSADALNVTGKCAQFQPPRQTMPNLNAGHNNKADGLKA